MTYSINPSANAVQIVSGECHDPGFHIVDDCQVLVAQQALNQQCQIRVVDGKVESSPVAPFAGALWDWDACTWVDSRNSGFEWKIIRHSRDRMLRESDWTQLPDVPLATKEVWATYRQALRDITLQPDPFMVVWPTSPT